MEKFIMQEELEIKNYKNYSIFDIKLSLDL